MSHYINEAFVRKSTAWLNSLLSESSSSQLKTQKSYKPVT